MDYHINQSIHINLIRIGVVANSSVLQIGSAGIIKPISKIYSPETIQEQINSGKPPKIPFKAIPE